jgi:hypothetical protein
VRSPDEPVVNPRELLRVVVETGLADLAIG